MKIEFTKMQGAGNDFIVIDEFEKELVPEVDKPSFVARVSDRHFGVGCDGVIFIQKSEKNDAKFLFYNPDGTKAEMCGNGIRCFAKYVYEKDLAKKDKIAVETLSGVKNIELVIDDGKVKRVTVDMGMPTIEFEAKDVVIEGSMYSITSIGMGNPHAIIFVEDVDKVDVRSTGKKVRNHREEFPRGVNVHFVQRTGDNEFKIRTYERGVEDETLACGTGICASAVAAVKNKHADLNKPLVFHARGGDISIDLEVEFMNMMRVHMTGGAEEVFTGTVSLGL